MTNPPKPPEVPSDLLKEFNVRLLGEEVRNLLTCVEVAMSCGSLRSWAVVDSLKHTKMKLMTTLSKGPDQSKKR